MRESSAGEIQRLTAATSRVREEVHIIRGEIYKKDEEIKVLSTALQQTALKEVVGKKDVEHILLQLNHAEEEVKAMKGMFLSR